MSLDTRVLMQPSDDGEFIEIPRVVLANAWQDLNNDTRMRQITSIQELMVPTRIDDLVAHQSSITMDVHEASAVWIGLSVESTLAPTDIRFTPQFSYGGDSAVFYDFLEGLWASMMFDDTDTAAGILRTYLLPCGGAYFLRFQTIATGANVGNFFDVRIMAQPFRGNFATAHS